jgi:hypothetical protein
MIDIPYTQLDLKLALLHIENKIAGREDEFQKICDNTIGVMPEKKMAAVAEFNGISVDMLVSSPNMKDLIGRYENHVITSLVKDFMDFGLDRKEAYALILVSIDPSKLDLD